MWVVKTSQESRLHVLEQKAFTGPNTDISYGSKLARPASLLTNETKKEFSFTKTIVLVHETLKNSLSCFHRPET